MIRKSMPSGLTRGWEPVFPRTNAKRLLGDHAQSKRSNGQRLVAEHGLDDDIAGLPGVERMPRDQIAAFGDDLVGILHDLELLVAVLPVQSHALADHFEDVDDAERPIALV